METRRRSLGERRQQLLDAAVTVMSERGIAATTTRAITDAAGVPQGMFHYCFDSKGALLRTLLERESENALATAWRLDPRSETLKEAITTAMRAQLERVRAAPGHFLVLSELTVVARTDPDLRELSVGEHRQYVDLIADLLARWEESLPKERLRAWAAAILAGLDGLTEAWLTTRDDAAVAASLDLLAASLSRAPAAE